jgi:WD40 repeat protein
LIATLSHDQLIVIDEHTFEREKMLKCSTSTFTDCAFSLSGNVLATLFADGSLFLWNPDDYSHRESDLAQKGLRLTLDSSSTIAVFNADKLFLADISKEVITYQ